MPKEARRLAELAAESGETTLLDTMIGLRTDLKNDRRHNRIWRVVFAVGILYSLWVWHQFGVERQHRAAGTCQALADFTQALVTAGHATHEQADPFVAQLNGSLKPLGCEISVTIPG